MDQTLRPPDLISRFRGPVRVRAPLHPLERAVLTVLCLHLGFLPWALGTMHAWSQVTSLCLAGLGFLIALIPRRYSGELAAGLPTPPDHQSPIANHQSRNPPIAPITSHISHSEGTSHHPPTTIHYRPLTRLLHFPLFWLGACLLIYICAQALNPSWVWERNETTWWLRRVTDIPWLPTSIDTPWERFNLWRQFIIYASAWLTVCTLWIGLTRRRSLEILLTAIVLNGIIFGIAGLYLRATATTDTVLWMGGRVSHATAFASFIYRNHAGAYLGLLTMAALGLAILHHERGRRQYLKSTPAALLILSVVFFIVCELFSYSRGGTLILGTALAAAALYLGGRLLFARSAGDSSPVSSGILLACLLGGIGLVAWKVDFGTVNRRFHSLISNYDQEYSVRGRIAATDAAIDMVQEYGVRGVGAGGFRFLFPEFIKKHPDFYRNGRVFWEHAHNDWLQVPIELGIAGVVPLLLGAIWLMTKYVRLRVWRSSVPAILALALAQSVIHAWFDFPFQCSTVLISWLVLAVLSLHWLEFEGA